MLLALLVPCAHAQGLAVASPVVAVESGGAGGAEYDHLDTVPRAPSRIARPPAPPHWTALPATLTATATHTRAERHPAPPHSPRGTRSLVLRC
nr:hypothetical protein [Streptomyces sp. SID5910]